MIARTRPLPDHNSAGSRARARREAERRVVGLGGLPTETRDPTGPYEERGYSDPAGHPFTLRPALLPEG